jgi:hypothetical protein
MRKQRILAQGAWYKVRTVINDGEPLFREQQRTEALLFRLLFEARKMFTFEMRGLALEGARLSFYIKPADGFQLPKIIQWLKQTFTVRYNLRAGRTGHRWGDRYWSEVLEGEPPEGAGKVDWDAMEAEAEAPTAADMRRRRKLNGVRPRQAETGRKPRFRPKSPSAPRLPPYKARQGIPLAAKTLSQQASTLPAGNGRRRGLPVAARGSPARGFETGSHNREINRKGAQISA